MSTFSKSTLSDFFVNYPYLLKLILKKSSQAKKRKYYTSYLMDFLFLGLSISFALLILNQFCETSKIICTLVCLVYSFHLLSYPTCSSYWLGLQLGKENLFVVGGNCRNDVHQSEKKYKLHKVSHLNKPRRKIQNRSKLSITGILRIRMWNNIKRENN